MSKERMLADLKRSGIKPKDVSKLGLKLLTAAATKKITERFEVAAYQIPYFDIHGKQIDYWRIRYLEEIKGKFGATLRKPPRYSQPIDTVPHFYFPPIVEWTNIAKDTEESIVITEGEKKAIAGCLNGLPTVGIGGVWAWKSKKHNLPVVPDFKVLKWKGRTVYLCFDNDLHSNPDVIGALNALARELLRNGAKPILVFLPKGKKMGLDDYLLKASAAKFAKLKMEEFKESEELWALNEEVCIITAKAAVYQFAEQVLFGSKQQLVGIAYADRTYQVPKPNGEGFMTKVAIEEWLKWPRRRTHRNLTYRPGDGLTVGNDVNTWKGWGIEPKRGTVKPFLDLIKFIASGNGEFYEWFLKWLAFPLQNPGTKLFTSVLLFSPHQGVGKSFIGYIMGDIYGENFLAISQEELHGNFNNWAARRQFILGEEITGTDRRRDADRLKNILTREQVYVNAKYQTEYSLPDCSNFMFTSNHPDSFFLEEKDRRTAVHEIPDPPEADKFYNSVDVWRAAGGASALFAYLLDLDVAGFNPKQAAPMSVSKQDMVELSRSDLDAMAIELRDNPSAVLHMDGVTPKKELFTIKELLAFIDPDARKGTTMIALSKALRRAGFRQKMVKTSKGMHRLWPVRNGDKWGRSSHGRWADHYEKHTKLRKF
jgi:hypothetical protein